MADADSRSGSSYLTPDLLAYVARIHAAHDSALESAFGAPESEGMPAIQVGPSEGKLLEILLRLVNARRVVEFGTLAGYSAIRMARVLPPAGRLFTLEFDPRHAAVARSRIEAAGLAGRVSVLVGDARELMGPLSSEGPFDAVFIDADKESYDQYGRWAAANLRPGGLLLGDNAFLFGRLLEKSPEAEAMRRFHEEAALAFDTVCIPTPDGLLLGVRH